MFCFECGKTIADNSKFCPECGKEIDTFDSDDTDEGKGGFSLFWIIPLSIIGIVTYFYFIRESTEDKAWTEDYRAIFIEKCLWENNNPNSTAYSTYCKCAADKVIKNYSTSELKDDLEDKGISLSMKTGAFNESYAFQEYGARDFYQECRVFQE
ncbi:MAG: hypothetical protein CL715_03720 [Chloroflexi bacterium]|nr:hypothetical protein [Chloroflexota bacterium]